MSDPRRHRLSEAELVILDKLSKSDDPSVLALCEAAKRLSELKLIEERFPPYAALLNRNIQAAYAIRFDEAVSIREEVLWGPEDKSTVQVLEHQLSCQVSDAFLCVRPYIQLLASPTYPTTLERLGRLGRLTLEIDHVPAINRAELAPYLADRDGYGVFRISPYIRPTKDGIMFEAGELLGKEAVPVENAGVFLPHGSLVKILLSYPAEKEELKLVAGLVMARYTTKAHPSGPYLSQVTIKGATPSPY